MFEGNVFDQRCMYFFTGRRECVYQTSGGKWKGIHWEWDEKNEFKFANERGKNLKRIPKVVMDAITADLKGMVKKYAPQLLKKIEERIKIVTQGDIKMGIL